MILVHGIQQESDDQFEQYHLRKEQHLKRNRIVQISASYIHVAPCSEELWVCEVLSHNQTYTYGKGGHQYSCVKTKPWRKNLEYTSTYILTIVQFMAHDLSSPVVKGNHEAGAVWPDVTLSAVIPLQSSQLDQPRHPQQAMHSKLALGGGRGGGGGM